MVVQEHTKLQFVLVANKMACLQFLKKSSSYLFKPQAITKLQINRKVKSREEKI